MRHVTFYRVGAVPKGGLVWFQVAEYPVPEALDDDSAVETAKRRLEEEHKLPSWHRLADVSLVRRS